MNPSICVLVLSPFVLSLLGLYLDSLADNLVKKATWVFIRALKPDNVYFIAKKVSLTIEKKEQENI